MPEYIERSSASACFENSKKVMWHKDDIVAALSSSAIPTADVVEVVRCKDCKYARKMVDGAYFCCVDHRLAHGENDFCSYGERKDGAE